MLTRVMLRSGNHGGDKRGNAVAKRTMTAYQMVISAMPKATGRRSARAPRRRMLESCNLVLLVGPDRLPFQKPAQNRPLRARITYGAGVYTPRYGARMNMRSSG